MKKSILVFAYFILLSTFSYSQGIFDVYPREGEAIPVNPFADSTEMAMGCDDLDPTNDCPYDNSPIKYISINIHYVLPPGDGGNFNEYGDGLGNSYTGYQHAEDIVDLANQQIASHSGQWNNPTGASVCEIPIRILLNGVYFHRTTEELVANSNPPTFNTCVQNCTPKTTIGNWFSGNLVDNQFEMNVMFISGTPTIVVSQMEFGQHCILHGHGIKEMYPKVQQELGEGKQPQEFYCMKFFMLMACGYTHSMEMNVMTHLQLRIAGNAVILLIVTMLTIGVLSKDAAKMKI